MALEYYVKYLKQRVTASMVPYWHDMLQATLQQIPIKANNAKHSYWLAQFHWLLQHQKQAIELLKPHSEYDIPSLCALSGVMADSGLEHAAEAAALAHQAQKILNIPCPETQDPMQVILRLALASEYPNDLLLNVKEQKLLEAYVVNQNSSIQNRTLTMAIGLYKAKMYKQALPLFKPLANDGVVEAAYYAGNIYHYGLAYWLNVPQARTYYEIGVKQEHGPSMYELAQMLGEFANSRANNTLRKELYAKAMLQGIEDAVPYVVKSKCRNREWHKNECLFAFTKFEHVFKTPGSEKYLHAHLTEPEILDSLITRPKYLREAIEEGHDISKLYAFLHYFDRRDVTINRNNLYAISKFYDKFSNSFWNYQLCDTNPKPYCY